MSVVILSAGLGTRLRPFTKEIPKAVFPLLNLPLFLYVAHAFEEWGEKHFFVNLHAQPEKVKPHFLSCLSGKVEFHTEADEILGNGGALKAFQSTLQKDLFWMANADSVVFPLYGNWLSEIEAHHRKNHNIATLLVIKHRSLGDQLHPIWSDSAHFVRKIRGDGEKGWEPWHFTGIMLLSPEILTLLPDGKSHLFTDTLPSFFSKNRVGIFPLESLWFEAGNPDDYLRTSWRLMELLDGNEDIWNDFKQEFLWASLPEWAQDCKKKLRKLLDNYAHSYYLPDHKALIGKNVILPKDLILKGFNVIGQGVRLGKESLLEQSVILPDRDLPNSFSLNSRIY